MASFVSGKLTSKGQLTIPSELREEWKLQEGDRLKFEIDEEGNIKSIVPVKKKSIKDLAGVLKTDLKLDLEQAREAYQKEAVDKIMSELNGTDHGE